MYLRIGLASDSLPVTIPHCIARRHRNPRQQSHFEDSWLLRPDHNVSCLYSNLSRGIHIFKSVTVTSAAFIDCLSFHYRHFRTFNKLFQTISTHRHGAWGFPEIVITLTLAELQCPPILSRVDYEITPPSRPRKQLPFVSVNSQQCITHPSHHHMLHFL